MANQIHPIDTLLEINKYNNVTHEDCIEALLVVGKFLELSGKCPSIAQIVTEIAIKSTLDVSKN